MSSASQEAQPSAEPSGVLGSGAWPLACPICSRELSRNQGAVVCSAGHAFDVAREGYINLLPSQHRARGIEGDTAAMLGARRRFLEAGWYRPLLDAVQAEVRASLDAQRHEPGDANGLRCVLEVGCGEGHYLGMIARGQRSPELVFVGADISKAAVRLASRRYPEATFIVADTGRHLYVHDDSASVLLDIFAPRNPAEFARVVKPGGEVVAVIPAPGHLGSLRAERGLLGIEEEKEARVVERFGEWFALSARRELAFGLDLPAESVRDLIEMGPNYWHVHREGDRTTADSVEVEASFVILRFERTGLTG